MNPVVTVLRTAHDLVARPGGWCQGWHSRPGELGSNTAYCAFGAIITASRPRLPHLASETIAAIEDAAYGALVLAATGTQHGSLIRWNDDPDRTQDEVVAAFHRAIAAQEQA